MTPCLSTRPELLDRTSEAAHSPEGNTLKVDSHGMPCGCREAVSIMPHAAAQREQIPDRSSTALSKVDEDCQNISGTILKLFPSPLLDVHGTAKTQV